MRLLMIDDNKEITDMLKLFFDINGHQCTVTNNGKEGLELIKNKKFDAVILDIAMPKFSGIDVIEQLEKDNILKKNKIIIMSAAPIEDKEIIRILKKGISTFLPKPVKPEVLLKTLETLGQ